MSRDATKPSPTPDAVAYYRCHGPEKNIARVGLTAWRSVLLEMIEDNLTLDEIHTWMTKHHKALHFQLPAKTTVRDWLTRVRQEIGKPLRQRSKSPDSAIQSPAPEAPPSKSPAPKPKPAVPFKSPETAPGPESPTEPKTEFNIQDLQNMTPEEKEAFLLGDSFKREDGQLVLKHPKPFGVAAEQVKKEIERLSQKPTA